MLTYVTVSLETVKIVMVLPARMTDRADSHLCFQ